MRTREDFSILTSTKSFEPTKHPMNLPSEEEINEQNALIGDFLIRFEHICTMIRSGITKICNPTYDKEQNANMELLLADVPADLLRLKLEVLIRGNYDSNKDLQQLSAALSKNMASMIPLRNTITHGIIFHGSSSKELEENLSEAELQAGALTTKVKTMKSLIEKIVSIDYGYNVLTFLVDRRFDDSKKVKFYAKLGDTTKKIESIKF